MSDSANPPEIAGDGLAARLAILLGVAAAGETVFEGLPRDAGLGSLIDAVEAFGAHIDGSGDAITLTGLGNGCLLEPEKPLELGGDNVSATLVAGLASAYDMRTEIAFDAAGAASFIQDVLQPLMRMGAQVNALDIQSEHLVVRGPRAAAPIDWRHAGAAPETAVAVLLAGLNALGETTVALSPNAADMVVPIFKAFGADIAADAGDVTITGQPALSGCTLRFF
jgi:3-phosphoshikimate 1-carboxyvinyltransferase